MVPTPVADNVIDRVREALQLLQSSIQEGELFQPTLAVKTFRISMSDLPEALILPSLQENIEREAPGIRIESYYTRRQNTSKELAAGTLNLAIEVPLFDDPNLLHRPLISERYVCMLRKGHEAATSDFSLDDYLSLGHIHISSRRQGMGHVELALNSLGIERRVQLRAQHYMIAPLIAMRTDLALTVPLSLAMKHDAEILELPFDIPVLEWHLYWHKSTDQDQANKWIREQLVKSCTP
jgi:DNA-binding transcriptional LysR family regulator